MQLYRFINACRMQMRHSVSSHLTLNLAMKFVVSLILLWVTAANPRLIKENGDSELSSRMKQNYDQLSRNVDIGTRENCLQDYSPCTCDSYPEIQVHCSFVSGETVRNVFRRVNDSEIDSLQLTNLIPSDSTNIVSLPADLLGDTRVTGRIDISTGSFSYRLVIDPLAFRASQNSLITEFSFNIYVDFGLQKDFSFFNGFNKLEYFRMWDSKNIFAFQYFPPLPSLRTLYLRGCTGLNDIPFPDLSPAKIENLWISKCSLNDEKADEIVARLIDSTSTESLLYLDLNENSLTRMPNRLGSPFAFPKLHTLDLGYNKIKTMENGTFQGSNLHRVYLHYNELVLFEEAVFKQLLEQMVTVYDGYLRAKDNPFAYGCDMAWLIRDNRNLLPAVDGYCGVNSQFPSASFQFLSPVYFANCPKNHAP